MHYEIVNVGGGGNLANAESYKSPRLSLDGRPLVQGIYGAAVVQLPAFRSADRRSLVRGFYAVLWPLKDGSPQYEAGALYFGPLSTANEAGDFIRDVSGYGGDHALRHRG